MIFVTGDTHGEFVRFDLDHFPEQQHMTHNDYVIICGDFGGVWDNSVQDNYWLDWLESRPFTTLFIDGNHENFAALSMMPIKDWHGGKVHAIRPHILHLMRGQVFEIDGLRFFTMGGAASHDISDGILDPDDPLFEKNYFHMRRLHKMFRVKNLSWWEEELPNEAEYSEAEGNLDRAGWKVDYIITHCAPTSICMELNSHYTADTLTDFHQKVFRLCDFQHWFFGHYHDNIICNERFTLLYEQIVPLPMRDFRTFHHVEKTASQFWLHYFNDYLLKNGMISKEKWEAMDEMIRDRVKGLLKGDAQGGVSDNEKR